MHFRYLLILALNLLFATPAPAKEVSLNGSIRKGYGLASAVWRGHGTLYYQWPFYERAMIQGLDQLFRGTINVELDQALEILEPDYFFEDLAWVPGRPNAKESFQFLRVQAEYRGKLYEGFIYRPVPSKASVHKLTTAELLMPEIPNLEMDQTIRIRLNAARVRLSNPWHPRFWKSHIHACQMKLRIKAKQNKK